MFVFHCLFLITSSLGAYGRLGFVTVAFSWYFLIYFSLFVPFFFLYLFVPRSGKALLSHISHISLVSYKRDIGNSVDQNQTPQNAASDQGQHCLH